MTILLTGASGFVGSAVLNAGYKNDLKMRPVYRSISSAKLLTDDAVISGLDETTDLSQVLNEVQVVIHAAGLSHLMHKESLDSLTEFRRVNLEMTTNLARQAAAAGVKRFVFISSIKVNGETTFAGRPFTAEDLPAPEDAYGVSKAEAELELRRVAMETGMEVTIIRPPLIYGHGVKGNFASLVNWVRRGLPLPLGGVTTNRRSIVALENLVDLILVCSYHPRAANQTFLISDGEDLSTTELLRKIGRVLNRPARLFVIPVYLIEFMAKLVGKRMITKRLLGSLQLDISKTFELLNWQPIVDVDEGLRIALE
jgi:nucleoside-diphosphate-sugar epimerase